VISRLLLGQFFLNATQQVMAECITGFDSLLYAKVCVVDFVVLVDDSPSRKQWFIDLALLSPITTIRVFE
jgi:hypothetical protein